MDAAGTREPLTAVRHAHVPGRRGVVLGWEDEDRALVLWGDAQFSRDPQRARVELVGDLVLEGA